MLLQGHDRVGRSQGVGRAVNQAVVPTFMTIGFVNYAFAQTLLATHPEINIVR